MSGSRILLGCLLLVVVGCASRPEVRQPMKDTRIDVWTPEDAIAYMKRLPD
jgi:hypothetical protein